MAEVNLKVQLRKNLGKGAARKLRSEQLIPGIVYGKGKECSTVAVNPFELKNALLSGGGINTLIHLNMEGAEKTAIVKEIQKDPILKKYLHVDFYELDLTKKVVVQVPLHFIGKPEGIKNGGILQPIIREVRVKCFPNTIPSNIKVDVTPLNIGDSLHMSDIKSAEDYEVIYEYNEAVATVAIPKEEAVKAPAAETALAETAEAKAEVPKEGEPGKAPETKEKETSKKEEKK